ncbi:MAG: dTMP kinase [Deltaproteobacteria bacterium]|nr:dTMP kinase [Deltaproteobacteria bacterium]
MIRGNLIALEGIDGAGTTTQAEELRKEFAKRGLPVHVTAEPSSGPVGSLVRQVLGGRMVVNRPTGVGPFGWATMALLFAADRQDHNEAEIGPNLHEGVNVLCDRYMLSSVVYQSLTSDQPDVRRWVTELNRYVAKPDLVLYIRVEAAEALLRRKMRDSRIEIFDDPELQTRLVEGYDRVGELFPELEMATIDGTGTVEAITAACWREIERVRAKGAPA